MRKNLEIKLPSPLRSTTALAKLKRAADVQLHINISETASVS